MMPDLSALGSPLEDEAVTDTGLVLTPEMKPEEQQAVKAPRRRPAPRKPKADAPTGEAPDEAAE